MAAYVTVRIIDIADAAAFDDYRKKTGPTIGAHGGKVIVGGGDRPRSRVTTAAPW